MNKSLLQTRLKSIAHYNEALAQLEETRKQTASTLKDIVDSLKEFCPLQHGDIVLYEGKIYRFRDIESISNTNPIRLNLKMQVQACDGYGRAEWRDIINYGSVRSPTFDDFEKYKVVGNTETPPI